MFDAIEIEKRGIPTITIAHDTFAAAAALHAKVLGLPEVPVVIEPLPESGVVSDDVERIADATIGEVLAALVSGPHRDDEGGGR